MKTTKLFLLAVLFAATVSKAQVSVNVNIGPPVWAPPAAPATVEYYYLPDIEVYYDVPAQRYIYLRNGVWTRSAVLPGRYRGYDLYHSHPVYLSDYHGRTPYVYYKEHKVKYKGNGNWKGNGHDNGHGKGKGHGKGHKK